MKKINLLMLLIAFIFQSIVAQTNNPGDEVFTVEALVCDSMGTAIKDVAVYDAKNNIRSVTDRDGIARIATHMGETFSFSHLSFNTKIVRIEKKVLIEDKEGRYSMLVVMQRKTNPLQEVTVTENAPHLAYANKKVWVMDYKVQHDGIYMLAGNNAESVLLHLGFEQDTISRRPIAPKYQELYRDAFNNLHLIGPDSTYQIYCDGKQLNLLYGNSIETFRQKLEPVVAATDSIIVLEKRENYGQEVGFVAVNRNNGQRFALQNVGGPTVEMAQNWNLDNYREDMMISDFGHKTIHVEANDEITYTEKNAKKQLMLRPVYCPLFGIGNELYLFAFPEDALIVFDQNGKQEHKMEMNFHKNLGTGLSKHLTSNNSWDNNLIFDPVRKMMYAQFKSDGIITLKEIDLRDGKTKREIQLTRHAFPQNIQIYDGEVYYLFLNSTQTAGKDRRSLYKMRLE